MDEELINNSTVDLKVPLIGAGFKDKEYELTQGQG